MERRHARDRVREVEMEDILENEEFCLLKSTRVLVGDMV